jgi:hypothetical protein
MTQLETFVNNKFEVAQLSDAERRLLRTLATPETAWCGPADSRSQDPVNDPARAADFGWSQSRRIRAEFLAWLCASVEMVSFIDTSGIGIGAAWIEGNLDLSNLVLRVHLTLRQCAIVKGIDLSYAQVPFLDLGGSRTGAVEARRLIVKNDMFCGDGFVAVGGVNLNGARISADLNVEGATLLNPGGAALRANGAIVGGSFILSRGFRAKGRVELSDVRVGGDFDARGSRLSNSGDVALAMTGGRVEGDVLLGDGFRAFGLLDLVGVQIKGDLICDGGRFLNRGRVALDADGAEIGRSAFLRGGFRAYGEVSFFGAHVGADLNFSEADLRNRGKRSLDARHAVIKENARFRGFATDAVLDFRHANVGGGLLFDRATFSDPSESSSGLRARYLTVSGEFSWCGIAKSKNTVLDLRLAKVGILRDDEESWPGPGNLSLDGFVYNAFDSRETDDGLISARTRLNWLRRQSRRTAPQPYVQLAKVLRESGHEQDAIKVLMAREDALYSSLGIFGLLKKCILKPTIAYGYRPMRALWFIAAFVVLGSILFRWGYDAQVIGPTEDGAFKEWNSNQLRESYPPFSSVVYSIETFFPLVELDAKKNWAPNPNLRPKCAVDLLDALPFRPFGGYTHSFGPEFARRLLWYLRFHIMFGWFFTGMFAAGVTGLVRRD